MGDGGVACVASRHVMDHFSVASSDSFFGKKRSSGNRGESHSHSQQQRSSSRHHPTRRSPADSRKYSRKEEEIRSASRDFYDSSRSRKISRWDACNGTTESALIENDGDDSKRGFGEGRPRNGHLLSRRSSLEKHAQQQQYKKSPCGRDDWHSRRYEPSRGGYDRYRGSGSESSRHLNGYESSRRRPENSDRSYLERGRRERSNSRMRHSSSSSQVNKDRRHSSYREFHSSSNSTRYPVTSLDDYRGRADDYRCRTDDNRSRPDDNRGRDRDRERDIHSRSGSGSVAVSGKDGRMKSYVEVDYVASPSRPHDNVTTEPKCNPVSSDSLEADAKCTGWMCIGQTGTERKPSELKNLVEEGNLHSNHLIRRHGRDEWVSFENAELPVTEVPGVTLGTECLNQQVRCLGDTVNTETVGSDSRQLQQPMYDNKAIKEYHIDERVEKLMHDIEATTGNGCEILSGLRRALRSRNECEGSPRSSDEYEEYLEAFRSGAKAEEQDYNKGISTVMEISGSHEVSLHYSGRCPLKGGDWKDIGERPHPCTSSIDKHIVIKKILNDGVVLCNIRKSGEPDPRTYLQEDFCVPSRVTKLDLPPWAYNWDFVKSSFGNKIQHIVAGSKCLNVNKAAAAHLFEIKEVAKTNSTIFREHGPSAWESSINTQDSECTLQKLGHAGEEAEQENKIVKSEGNVSPSECHVEFPKIKTFEEVHGNGQLAFDRFPTIADLKLHQGDWYCRDGSGLETGPFTLMQLQKFVQDGTLVKGISAYRKSDNIWVPITEDILSTFQSSEEYAFDRRYSHFLAYARGKLHEHVMKLFKKRDFAATVGGVLDTWWSSKQSQNITDTCISNLLTVSSSLIGDNTSMSANLDSTTTETQNSEVKHTDGSCSPVEAGLSMEAEKFGGHTRLDIVEPNIFGPPKCRNFSKRRFQQDISDYGKRMNQVFEISDESDTDQQVVCSMFEPSNMASEKIRWETMREQVLMRVFDYVGAADLKSLVCCAATCKHWRDIIYGLRSKFRRIDFCSFGSTCTDMIFQRVMVFCGKSKLKHISLKGCINVSLNALIQCLRSCPSVISVDISGCNQLKEVTKMFHNIKWQRCSSSVITRDHAEQTSFKMKSLKQINDKTYGAQSKNKSFHNNMDVDEDTILVQNEIDHIDTIVLDDFQEEIKFSESPPYRRSYNKRVKLNINGKLLKSDLVLGNMKGDKIRVKLISFVKNIMTTSAGKFYKNEVEDLINKIKIGLYTGNVDGIKSLEDDYALICRKAFQKHKKGPEYAAAEEMFRVGHRFFASLRKNLDKSFFGEIQHLDSLNFNEMRDRSQNNLISANSKKRHGRGMASSTTKIKRRKFISQSDVSTEVMDVSDHEPKKTSRQRRRCSSYSESETSPDSRSLEEDEKSSEVEESCSDMDSGIEDYNVYKAEQRQRHSIPGEHYDCNNREWGARMTHKNLVAPLSRKYETIDKYVIVDGEDEVRKKMEVVLPKDYEEKCKEAESEYSHLDIPVVKDFIPRKRLSDEVIEQEVYGIDPYTYNLLLDTIPKGFGFSIEKQHFIIEEVLLRVLNKEVQHFTGKNNAPMEYPLQCVVERMVNDYEKSDDTVMHAFCRELLMEMQSRQPEDRYFAYRKGLGVICNKEGGFKEDDFIVEFLGEVYPLWRWYEKEEAVRYFQKKNQKPLMPGNSENSGERRKKKDKGPAPEFYNITLERPKGDGAGYDVLVIDAMHKANYASRICHSCRPNCEAKVTAVNGSYQIGLYTLRHIQYGEEITFDYNCVTESQEEFEATVCLCGSRNCRGSYFNFSGASGYEKVLNDSHHLLKRYRLLLEACIQDKISADDYNVLHDISVGSSMLSMLPKWAIVYAAKVARFINYERRKLPKKIFDYLMREKQKAGIIYDEDSEWIEANNQAEGVSNIRLQYLGITLDKVRYILRKSCPDPENAPPPLRKLRTGELISVLWKGNESLVEELLHHMAPYVNAEVLKDLKQKINARDPSMHKNQEQGLREALFWLRDELHKMPSTYRSRHGAAADLIHLYAHTRHFFTAASYGPVTSEPLYITPLDLGLKHEINSESGCQPWQKTYKEDHILGQLIYWHKPTCPDPGRKLNIASRGCAVLPRISSCFAKSNKQDFSHRYGRREREEMISWMENRPPKHWPDGGLWEFDGDNRLFGSPVLDAVLGRSSLDGDMLDWLTLDNP